MKKVILALAIVAALVTGCIVYQDGSELWDTGRVDKQLNGKWCLADHPDGPTFVFKPESNRLVCAVMYSPTNDILSPVNARLSTRTVDIDGMTFLMFHNVRDELYRSFKASGATDIPNATIPPDWGWIVRYSLSNDRLALHMPPQSVIQAAIKDGSIKGTLPGTNSSGRTVDAAKLTTLDSNTLSVLKNLFHATNTWSHITEYVKQE